MINTFLRLWCAHTWATRRNEQHCLRCGLRRVLVRTQHRRH